MWGYRIASVWPWTTKSMAIFHLQGYFWSKQSYRLAGIQKSDVRVCSRCSMIFVIQQVGWVPADVILNTSPQSRGTVLNSMMHALSKGGNMYRWNLDSHNLPQAQGRLLYLVTLWLRSASYVWRNSFCERKVSYLRLLFVCFKEKMTPSVSALLAQETLEAIF